MFVNIFFHGSEEIFDIFLVKIWIFFMNIYFCFDEVDIGIDGSDGFLGDFAFFLFCRILIFSFLDLLDHHAMMCHFFPKDIF